MNHVLNLYFSLKTVDLWKHLHNIFSIQFVRTSFDDMLKISAWDS